MEIIGSRFRDDVDYGAGFSSKFRIVIRFCNVEFTDVVNRRVKDHIVEILVRDVDAVHEEQIVSGSVPHHIDQLAGLLQGISARAAWGIDHAFAQQRQFQKLTPFQWKIHDLLVLNHVLDFRGLEL